MVAEANPLYLGLKHHIFAKEIGILKLKSTVENYTNKLPKVHKISLDNEFKDELKYITSAFFGSFDKSMLLKVQSSFTQLPFETITKSKIKICQFNNGNNVVVQNSDYYFKQLHSIVNDPAKFKEIILNLDSNAL